MPKTLITISNCSIANTNNILINNLTWNLNQGESWLIIGPNGGGKEDFLNALSNNYKIIPKENGLYSNIFQNSIEIVSLEQAAKLIQEERENDESEYLEGGIDIGRTGRIFLAEALIGKIKKGLPLPKEALTIEKYPAIRLCGIENILDRGLKYMSTGEIRRTLLARALISGKKLLILSDPFAGLDINSRNILKEFFNQISLHQNKDINIDFPHIILSMERWHEIPDNITNVIEFSDKNISFLGTRLDYEQILQKREKEFKKIEQSFKNDFSSQLEITLNETSVLQNQAINPIDKNPLVEMYNVNVGWDNHIVLNNFSWTLYPNEHWLIQGPNGSGKTTFLELITGDNMQVFSNDVRLFGKKRGSGESIWDIKKQLGIVSYRLHVEYRMIGSISLQNVIISGFKDSIGLYEKPTDIEISAAKKWLKLGGFENRENEIFSKLSYGEQRAILILRSAVKCPKILILDEPCHGLDENYRKKILHLMNLIGSGNSTTMLHVTHDQSEILECEKHVLELHPNENPMYKIVLR